MKSEPQHHQIGDVVTNIDSKSRIVIHTITEWKGRYYYASEEGTAAAADRCQLYMKADKARIVELRRRLTRAAAYIGKFIADREENDGVKNHAIKELEHVNKLLTRAEDWHKE
jgi:hypothetical protein